MHKQQFKTQLQREYSLRFGAERQYRNEVWRIKTTGLFRKYIPPTSTVLNLGSGQRNVINNFLASKKYGIGLTSDRRARLAAEVKFFDQECFKKWQ